MKKLFTRALLLLFVSFFFTSVALADMPPMLGKPIRLCLKVVNLDDYPDVALLRKTTLRWDPVDSEVSEIENNQCLFLTNDRYTLDIYWAEKTNPNKLDEDKLLFLDLDGGVSIYNNILNPLMSIVEEYSIVKTPEEDIIFYKSKRTKKYWFGFKIVKKYPSPLDGNK